MAIVKCQNPQCDYFQKPVPEGDYCPFCGEPLPTKQSSTPQIPSPPVMQPPVVQNPNIPPQPSFTPPVQPLVGQPPVVQNPNIPPQPSFTAPVQPPVVQNPNIPPQPSFTPPVQPPVGQNPNIPPQPSFTPPVQPIASPPPAYYPDDSPATVYEAIPSPYPTLKLVHTSGKEFFVMIGQKAYIGRRGGQKKPHPEIDVTDIPFAERVSRPHAHIFWDEQAKSYMIVDNQSTNGTIINGEFLKPWHPYPLIDGATLELGKERYVQFSVQIR